jgi:hypothetical protein
LPGNKKTIVMSGGVTPALRPMTWIGRATCAVNARSLMSPVTLMCCGSSPMSMSYSRATIVALPRSTPSIENVPSAWTGAIAS